MRRLLIVKVEIAELLTGLGILLKSGRRTSRHRQTGIHYRSAARGKMQFGIITILKCYKLPRLYIERYQVSLRECDVRGIMLFYIGHLAAAARGLTQLITVRIQVVVSCPLS
jgi:hypothetical protein